MLVGITGQAQHGKDTVGKVFVNHGYTRYGFADALKELALLVNPIIRVVGDDEFIRLATLVTMIGWDAAKKDAEVRRFLQQLGTRIREVIGEDVWIDALYNHMEDDQVIDVYGQAVQDIVITDVRFPNEERVLHDLGAVIVRVVRRNADGTYYDAGVSKSHASEQFVSTLDVDYEIEAVELSDLLDKAERLVASLED